MIIQSKRIWIVNTWCAGQLEIELGKIKRILPYRTIDADYDYGDNESYPALLIYIHTELTALIPMMRRRRDFVPGSKELQVKGYRILPTTVTQSEEVLIARIKKRCSRCRQRL